MFSLVGNFVKKIKLSFAPKETIITLQQPAGNGMSMSQANYNYNSGYGSGDKFPGGMSSGGGSIVTHDHFTLRQYAREAMYDSTVAKSMVDRFADTVVDTGLKANPTPKTEIIGITPEAGEAWGEDVGERFHLWAKSKKSHRSRINTFYQNQRMYQIFQQRDNDIFTRFFYGRDGDQINPLSIDFIDPNQIRGYAYTSTYCQISDGDGIIRDKNNRETKYKTWYWDKEKGSYEDLDIPARGEKSGRIMMIHGFNPEYVNQGRGFPRLSHALQEFENLTDFKASTIKKAIAQSSLIMAVENDQQDGSNPLESLVSGPRNQYPQNGIVTDSNSETVTNDTPLPNYSMMPEATLHEPGATGVFNLRQGDKLNYLRDTSPSENYDAFVNSFCSYLAASNGMPIEVLLMKFNANYSASRASLILFWRVAQIWRDEMSADFLDPVYEMWLSEEIASGRVKAPGWLNPLIREAWLCKEWTGAPMPNIDPLKTMAADKGYTEMSAQTLDDVARNLNGSSGKANRIKNKRQFEELPPSPFNPAQGGDENNSKDKSDKEDE